MRIVDAHVHLYPPDANRDPAGWARKQGETHWEILCARVRKNGLAVQGFPSVDELLRTMDAAGVDRAVLQAWYWERHDTCVLQNRFFAACLAAHPDRISACLTFHPGAGADAVLQELRWAKDHGFCGVGEMSPHSQAFAVDDPVWREALQACAVLALPVMLHVTEPAGKGYPGRILTPLDDFVRLAREHRATQFILAHWAARLPLDPQLGPESRSLLNVAYDTAASPLLYPAGVFREMIAAVGVDRVLFGSDYPLNLYPREQTTPEMGRFVAEATGAGLSAVESASLLAANAERIYGL
ncbi:amidohydrolase [Opitutaceae bacterium EW11]|nr:amidohydrolase [Opitutaceae bacterium EW11]